MKHLLDFDFLDDSTFKEELTQNYVEILNKLKHSEADCSSCESNNIRNIHDNRFMDCRISSPTK